MTLGHVVGPLPLRQVPGVHISPFRVIPKGHTPGKWQLIVDLSSPAGGSINDGIPAEWCSLSYIKVDGVARHVAQLQRSVIGKDGHSASVQNLVPVHPDDRALLGMKWEGGVYKDTRLPFGLRSAPITFLVWCIQDQGVKYICHYLNCRGWSNSGWGEKQSSGET